MSVVLSDANVEEAIIDSRGLLMFEMYEKNSGITIIMQPLINRLRKKYRKDLKHYRIDIYSSPGFCKKYHVESSTYLLIFDKNKLVGRIEGLVPYFSLEGIISEYLENTKNKKK